MPRDTDCDGRAEAVSTGTAVESLDSGRIHSNTKEMHRVFEMISQGLEVVPQVSGVIPVKLKQKYRYASSARRCNLYML